MKKETGEEGMSEKVNEILYNALFKEKYRKVMNEFVRRALEKYGDKIDSSILCGSVARGEAGKESDIDILVVAVGDRFKIIDGWIVVRLRKGLQIPTIGEYKKFIKNHIVINKEVSKTCKYSKHANIRRSGKGS